MAEPSYINPKTFFNFHVIPATTKLNDSELNVLVWDITVGNNQNQVAKISFFKSGGLINIHGRKFIVSNMININHVSQILGGTNLSIFDGLFDPLDWQEYHPWESVNLRKCQEYHPFRTDGNKVDTDDNSNDGGSDSGNDGNGGGHGNGDGGNGGGDGHGNGGNNGGNCDGNGGNGGGNGNGDVGNRGEDGHGNGGNDGGDGNGNDGNRGGDCNGDGGNGGGYGHGNGGNDGRNGNAASNIRIHMLDVNHNYIEIISTNIVADEYAHWCGIALAIYSVWLQRNSDQYHTATIADVNPWTCWPGCVVSFGQVAEDGSLELYDWQRFKFAAVRKEIRDVILFEIP